MSFDDYLRFTWSERIAIHAELDDIIERTSPDPEGEGGSVPARPRRQRK